MRQNTTILTVLVLTTGLASRVLAQGGDPMGFVQFDRNGDGIVTEAEFNQARAERIAARSSTGAPMRGLANAATFSDLDQNGDGQLTPDELANIRAQRMGSRGSMGPGTGMGSGGMSGAGQGPGMGSGMGRMGGQMPMFSSFDANGDGLISEDEFAQGRAERIKERSQQGYPMRNLANAPSFEAIDQNGDGSIDQQELANAQRQQLLEHQRMMQP